MAVKRLAGLAPEMNTIEIKENCYVALLSLSLEINVTWNKLNGSQEVSKV